MDIACPHCAATYRVPDSLVAGGKALRCAACGQEWVPQGRTAEPVAPPPLAERDPDPPVPAGRVSPPGEPRLPRRDPGPRAPEPPTLLPAAWIASIAAIVLGVAALYLYRAPIAAAWPPFGRLF